MHVCTAKLCLYLQSDIMDVNQIFKDLGMLVHEQGEVIGKGAKYLLICRAVHIL